MKREALNFLRFVSVAVTGVLLTGCLMRRATDSTRHFILAPISTNKLAVGEAEHLSVGVCFVKVPSYLLRSSIVVRNGDNEIEYLDNARWGERLDLCLQRTLAANLSRLLPSDKVYVTDWARDQVTVTVSVDLQQFDVDTRGRGTLIAQWRIATPDSDTLLNSGTARLNRSDVAPHSKPDIVAATLSELVKEFSCELAEAIRKSNWPCFE